MYRDKFVDRQRMKIADNFWFFEKFRDKMKRVERKRFRIEHIDRDIFVAVEKRRVKLIKLMQIWRRDKEYIFVIQKRIQFQIICFEIANAILEKRCDRLEKRLTKTKQQRDETIQQKNETWTKTMKLAKRFEMTKKTNDNNNESENNNSNNDAS